MESKWYGAAKTKNSSQTFSDDDTHTHRKKHMHDSINSKKKCALGIQAKCVCIILARSFHLFIFFYFFAGLGRHLNGYRCCQRHWIQSGPCVLCMWIGCYKFIIKLRCIGLKGQNQQQTFQIDPQCVLSLCVWVFRSCDNTFSPFKVHSLQHASIRMCLTRWVLWCHATEMMQLDKTIKWTAINFD